jgi:hypothetical protein
VHINFKIVMLTSKVQSLLETHRENHILEYQAQLEGWKKEMETYSMKVSAWAYKGGEPKDRPHQANKPQDFTEDYDNLIDMVKNHTRDEMQLDHSDFEIIVKDKFGWKETFHLNSTMYSSK